MDYHCNHCDECFSGEEYKDDIVCPQCGAGVVTKNSMLTHPANKPMRVTKAKEIISWLGWRGFKKACPDFTSEHPELRPISQANSAKLVERRTNERRRRTKK